MKKIFTLLTILLTGVILVSGCGKTDNSSSTQSNGEKTVLTVAADAVPHAELLNFVKPELEKEGVELKIIVLDASTGSLANEQTDNGEYDVNFFQHLPYLDSVKSEKGYDLAAAGSIHVEPIGFYSVKYKSKEEIPDGAKIAIPNDATNEYRALKILENNGFIKLKSTIQNYSATINDIETNTKNLKITELDSANIIRVKDEFDGYVTNTNKILDAGIDANTALFREGKDSPYANILVTKTSRVNDAAIVKLKNALTTPEVKKFIEETYKGAVIPAF